MSSSGRTDYTLQTTALTTLIEKQLQRRIIVGQRCILRWFFFPIALHWNPDQLLERHGPFAQRLSDTRPMRIRPYVFGCPAKRLAVSNSNYGRGGVMGSVVELAWRD